MPELILEECPYCEGEAEGCSWCEDGVPGYIEHDCDETSGVGWPD